MERYHTVLKYQIFIKVIVLRIENLGILLQTTLHEKSISPYLFHTNPTNRSPVLVPSICPSLQLWPAEIKAVKVTVFILNIFIPMCDIAIFDKTFLGHSD